MKPHIRKRHGIWYCCRPTVWGMGSIMAPPWGHGRTPAEAYADWKEQQ
jgi:hypothetical protein